MTLQERLQQFMSEHHISQAQASKAIGMSGATVNLWMQGKYSGDNTMLEYKVQSYLEREQERLKLGKLEHVLVNTATTEKIMNFLSASHTTCENALLYGNAGMGKTTALRHYVKQHTGAILIEAMPTYTPAVVLKTIAKKIGVTVSGSLNDINEAILAKISQSGRLIIVDEAENLSTKSLEILRRLHDQAEVGLVLAGMPRLKANLMGRHGELAQLFSRVGYVLELPERVANDELAQIVRATLPSLEDNLLKDMVKRAEGSPRRLWKMMTIAYRASKTTGDPINADMLSELDQMLLKN